MLPMSPCRLRAGATAATSEPPPPPAPLLTPWAGPGATGGRVRAVGSPAAHYDPENILPPPPAFGDPAGGPSLPGGAPPGHISASARQLVGQVLAKVGLLRARSSSKNSRL